jgi:hypothetical protein
MKKDVFSSNEFTSSADPILVDAGSLTYRLAGFTVSYANTKSPPPPLRHFHTPISGADSDWAMGWVIEESRFGSGRDKKFLLFPTRPYWFRPSLGPIQSPVPGCM